ncbi:alpha/beta hydrolase fold domain-containing protein [Flammeovirga sp. SJP92]|uniref:alpha/beta hydrolase fold domain-containing protein n=1 Tax=Flammeovirga sp. SJP92 TaxID=1775430 RepID=UPI0007875E03|nr:alpha/beta hydrolase fold domain-containing protein [Flammeovirga sp. SJP92]KXX71210.1 esterase [Flammeovirga sp. SJP92]
MKHSLSYYIVKLVLQLKGIKKDFSKDPIDYQKIRKEDIYHPKGRFFKQKGISNFQLLHSKITEVQLNENSESVVLFLHGGAFISGPAAHHWDAVKSIVKKTSSTVWFCNYPKAPEHKIVSISENIDHVYEELVNRYPNKKIILLGDSAGGTLATALTQRLVLKNKKLPVKVILLSPVMDASMSNNEIEKVELKDPMLSKIGVRSAKKLCADENLDDPEISPLNGSFDGFPSCLFLMAENDVTYPDQVLTVEKMKSSGIDLEVINGEDMPHIWAFLPVMEEGKRAFEVIISHIKMV